MKRQGIWVGLAVIVMATALGGYAWYQQQVAGGTGHGAQGGPVELSSTHGDFSLSRLDDDQLAILFFGYTYCPDVCPMSMAVVRQALAELDDESRERVVPVLISVDPERDTLERLAEYTGYFGDAFIGATGSEAQLEEIAERYGVVWRRVETPESAMEYTIDHSSSLYLVDREGRIQKRVLYSPAPHALISALESELGG
ncbi:SCO family protein [Halomonas heilongjiangensis]|uniref:SCO family protein n=1 Tax=Halomonas heilongjiangensis TaxID=1387883 RepID=A0A2N7TIP7_9GAMM|nr:SCO family protein [Halomonas heilongjiangensis]PMR68059.1 SCO family protein [Halomonas heilongjiangensis]PXX92189.1 SCO family protein [Halomonas heilongjiangensis]